MTYEEWAIICLLVAIDKIKEKDFIFALDEIEYADKCIRKCIK